MKFKFQQHKAVLEHNHAHSFTYLSMATFGLQWQNWVTATETMWPTNPKITGNLDIYRKSMLTPVLTEQAPEKQKHPIAYWYMLSII